MHRVFLLFTSIFYQKDSISSEKKKTGRTLLYHRIFIFLRYTLQCIISFIPARVKVFSRLLFQSLEEITKLVFNSPPRPVPQQTSASVINLISKMLRKQSSCRPRTDQLVLCPFLAPYIVRVYLNLGRSINLTEREPESFGSHIFLKFLNSPHIIKK